MLDTIFPPHCVICEDLGRFICFNCEDKILEISTQTCVFCNKITKKGRLCLACRTRRHLTGVICFGYFKDKYLKEIIHAYKYEDLFALKEILANYLLKLTKEEKLTFDIITFVPISKKRLVRRGYNQSQLLAEELGKLTNVPVIVALKKIKETKTQVGLKRKERIKNLKDSYGSVKKIDLNNKKVLLIDDVVTTETTLDECAKVLRKSGAREVWGLTLAKE